MKEGQRTCSRPHGFRRWSFAVALSLLACAVPTALSAQPWSGDSALGVQIRGARGPVAGAIVEIRRQRSGLNYGPASRKTDSRGQANFVGISQGRWNLEIKHPDYLSFVASIHVQRGKKPEVLTQFLEASGPGRRTFRVKFLRSHQSLGEALPGTAASEPAIDRPVSTPAPGFDRTDVEKTEPSERVNSRAVPTQIVTPVAQPQAPASHAAAEPVDPVDPVSDTPNEPTSKTELEAKPPPRTAEVPMPLDRPIARPAARPEESPLQPPIPVPPAPIPVEAPAVSATAPVPEPLPEPLPESEPPSSSTSGASAGRSVPTPDELPAQAVPPALPVDPPTEVALDIPSEASEPFPEPAPMPGPALPGPEASEPESVPVTVSPGPPVFESTSDSLRAYRDRSCFECKPGEWAVAIHLDVPSGEACRTTAEVAVRRALRDVAAAASEQLADFSGPLPLDLAVFPLSAASLAARNTLAPYLEPTASCRFLAVVVPERGRFTGFRFEARDANASGTCSGEEECEIGQARFLFSPGIARGAGASIIYSVFENTGDSERIARMTGFFLPTSGWTPRADG